MSTWCRRYFSPSVGVVERILRRSPALSRLRLSKAPVFTIRMPARLEVGQVHLERGRVHRHQRVELIARRVDPLAAELELEARHAEQRAGGGPDLGGEVGQRRDVVAGPRRLGRELLAGHLHAVARVAGEPDHGAREGAARLLGNPCRRSYRSSVCPSFSSGTSPRRLRWGPERSVNSAGTPAPLARARRPLPPRNASPVLDTSALNATNCRREARLAAVGPPDRRERGPSAAAPGFPRHREQSADGSTPASGAAR